MQLRPYQDKAVSHATDMLFERGNSLIVAGTGAGKTIMLAAVIGRFINGFYAIHGKKPHVLVLVHRNEIHTQNHSKFSLVCPNVATSEITQNRKSLHGNVHFGMVQTVSNLLPEFEKAGSYFDLIVIDEAHHAAASTYEDIISWNNLGKPNSALLGVTATPNRGDKLPLIHLFDNYYQISVKFLIDSHYLVRPTFLDLSPTFEIEGKTETGHLAKNCKDDMAGRAMIDNLCDTFLERKEKGKSIIFAPSHDFCEKIYDRLKSSGRNPAYLGLNLDDVQRKAELDRFENGDSDELINVDICTEGYDYPELRNLVDFDTNGTHGQWVQKVGRVLRTSPGKTTCTVIDFGGNILLYPDGIETDVALEGAMKTEGGRKLTERDLFAEKTERASADVIERNDDVYTPYNAPKGFETINDMDYGIVFVACGEKKDCIIVQTEEKYILYTGDKKTLLRTKIGDFNKCLNSAFSIADVKEEIAKPISNMQIKLLAPEYPTQTLTWYGANCCICWKTWKSTVKADLEAGDDS
ncbi:MAG: DEAD/DEAH box helicase [Clostridia bacterium]|nr:DEAD/DEAH box helicase [Clostridia bacterium]